MGATDDGLLAGMAAGDEQAAAEFVRRYQARVFGLAMTIVSVPSLAEDVAQEAFVRAWRFAGAYDPRRGGVASWLLAIARNAAIDALRLSRDQPYDSATLLAMLAHADTGAARDDPERVADVHRLRSALSLLPHDQVVAVVLATIYGLSAREIAEREGIPLGTAKTRIRLGLAHLRERLEVSDERDA